MAKPRKIYTIAEAISLVEERFDKLARMPDLIGFRSIDMVKSYKNLITLCNSMSIVFLQYDLFKEAFLMLQKAVVVDSELNKFGTVEDKLWQGRLITYNSLALLFHKLGRHKESLKLLLQAENFLINLTEVLVKPQIDIEISFNMLTFVTLWKVKKHKEALVYVERSVKLINFIISGRRPSQISKVSAKNLYGIIVMSLAALRFLESNQKKALTLCKDAVRQLEGNNILSRPLLLQFIKLINENSASSLKIPEVDFKSTSNLFETQNSAENLMNFRLRNAGDWLVSDKYEKVLFITTFVPLISPTTPWIDTKELEANQSRSLVGGSEGNGAKKVRTVLGRSGRTESTPRPRREQNFEALRQRRMSQEESNRSASSLAENRHIMFEFSSIKGKKGVPIELVPIQPSKTALPKLHKTLINFKDM